MDDAGASWRLPAATAVALLVLGVFDHSGIGPTRALNVYSLPAFGAAAVAVSLAVLWRERNRAAGAAALTGAVLSLGASGAALAAGLPRAAAGGSWLYTETASLLALVLVAVWAAPVRWAVAATGSVAVAVGMLVVRFRALADSGEGIMSAALLWSLGALSAAGLGLRLRNTDERRQRAVRDVRRAERLELARDLHDFVAHHVSGMVVRAQAAQLVCARDPSGAVRALKDIEEAGSQALASMRHTVGMLRETDAPGAASGSGAGREAGQGLAALPELVERFPQATLSVAAGLDPPPATATTAYRVVLEALTNVRRHAPAATRVEVGVAAAEDGLRIVVTDDCAHSPARSSRGGGFGLIGLRERVDAVGGTLVCGPREPAGWQVEATLPLGGASLKEST